MKWITDKDKLVKTQYADPTNLLKRAQIHKYGVNNLGWIPFILSYITFNKSDIFLELGCGTAELWKQAIHKECRIKQAVLSDVSEGMLEKAKANINCNNLFPIEFKIIDAMSIPFPDNFFDAVIANHVLYHVSDIDICIDEINRILKPDGRFYGTTIGKKHMIELAAYSHQFASEVSYEPATVAERFGLENGKAILSRCFKKVKKYEYEDHLEIPNVEPLVEYIVSVDNDGTLATQEAKELLKKNLEEKIDFTVKFKITKQSGIFVGMK